MFFWYLFQVANIARDCVLFILGYYSYYHCTLIDYNIRAIELSLVESLFLLAVSQLPHHLLLLEMVSNDSGHLDTLSFLALLSCHHAAGFTLRCIKAWVFDKNSCFGP